ncbi:MAG: hypothetical protein ACOCWA_07525 [Bacteroidota bacterium]
MKKLKLPATREGEIRVEIKISTLCSWFFRYYFEKDNFYEGISEEEKDHVIILGKIRELREIENDFNMVLTNSAEERQNYIVSISWRHYINGELFSTLDKARYSGELDPHESREIKLHVFIEKRV